MKTGSTSGTRLAGSYRVSVSKDGYYSEVSRAVTVPPPVFDLHVGLTPVVEVTTNALATGQKDTAYSETLAATGGRIIEGDLTPYTWSVSAGSLPTGLDLDADTGEISGTPTTTGKVNFTIMARMLTGIRIPGPLSITITTVLLNITSPSLPDGEVTVAYDASPWRFKAVPRTHGRSSPGLLPAGINPESLNRCDRRYAHGGLWTCRHHLQSDRQCRRYGQQDLIPEH